MPTLHGLVILNTNTYITPVQRFTLFMLYFSDFVTYFCLHYLYRNKEKVVSRNVI